MGTIEAAYNAVYIGSAPGGLEAGGTQVCHEAHTLFVGVVLLHGGKEEMVYAPLLGFKYTTRSASNSFGSE